MGFWKKKKMMKKERQRTKRNRNALKIHSCIKVHRYILIAHPKQSDLYRWSWKMTITWLLERERERRRSQRDFNWSTYAQKPNIFVNVSWSQSISIHFAIHSTFKEMHKTHENVCRKLILSSSLPLPSSSYSASLNNGSCSICAQTCTP